MAADAGVGADVVAAPAVFEHLGQQVGADLHQPEAAVVALATGVDIVQLPDLTLLKSFVDGLILRVEPPLVVHCDLDALLGRLVHDRVGFQQIHAHRLFNFDIDPVFEYS